MVHNIKNLIAIFFILSSVAASGQGIGIQLKNSGGTYAHILRDGVQMKVTDSLGNIRLSTAITGIDTTNARVSRLINLFPTSLLNGRFRVVDTTANDLLTVANSRITTTNTALDTTNARLNRLLDRLPASLLTGKLSVIDTTGNYALSDIITHTSSTATNCVEINTNTTGLIQKIDTVNQLLTSIISHYQGDSILVYATNGFGSGGGGSSGPTTIYDSTITRVSMTITGLDSLASSATVGWGSDSVTNYRKASDYRISVSLKMSATSPANDKMIYVYICPIYNNNGTYETSSQGTATLPSLSVGSTTIAAPNNLRLLGVLPYTTASMTVRDTWSLSEIFPVMPDAFKIIIINFSGAALRNSSNSVSYTPIFKTQR